MNEDERRLRNALNELTEHFDSVQLFASRHEPEVAGGTVHVSDGSGNWFAREGQVRAWLIKQDEVTRCNVRKAQEP